MYLNDVCPDYNYSYRLLAGFNTIKFACDRFASEVPFNTRCTDAMGPALNKGLPQGGDDTPLHPAQRFKSNSA